VDIICSCGDCRACQARDEFYAQGLSEDEFVYRFGKTAWFKQFERKQKRQRRSAEQEIAWSKRLNEILWQVRKNRQEYDVHLNELMRREA